MVNDEDLEAGLLQVLELLGELVSRGGSVGFLFAKSVALLFLQALITF